MPILMPKAPVAHTLPVLSAMLSIVAALSRFELGGFARRACSGTKVLTRHCSGSASPPTEFIRWASEHPSLLLITMKDAIRKASLHLMNFGGLGVSSIER